MPINQVLGQIISPAIPNLSSRFKNAVGFFINLPFVDTEIEIDVFLQIYLSFNQVRNIPLGKIEEQAVLLNITDSETCQFIPQEYLDTDLEMALLFLPSESMYLEAFVINQNVLLSDLQNQLSEIQLLLQDAPTLEDIADTVVDIGNLFLPLFGLPPLLLP